MKNDDKIIDIIISLHERGFDHDFIVEQKYIRCLQCNVLIAADDFEIVETYYGESKSTTGNGSAIYAIILTNYDIKGILMSSYRSYINGMFIHLWPKFNNTFRINVNTGGLSKSEKRILV
ncbi:hypothetical protein [Mucilaginibacter sp.]|uniref:hypothetical protein n=1 Tax=Mucilaginibacter sp. TaxID=1882438 RepID=UPI0025ED71B0|nr:hypothetical protein [Mucilaginibacter sp.]